MQIGVRAHLNGIAWSSEFRTVVQRLVCCKLQWFLLELSISYIGCFSCHKANVRTNLSKQANFSTQISIFILYCSGVLENAGIVCCSTDKCIPLTNIWLNTTSITRAHIYTGRQLLNEFWRHAEPIKEQRKNRPKCILSRGFILALVGIL